jgi:hypothetical protein
VVKPISAKREIITKLGACIETLSAWLTTNRHRGKPERRSVLSMRAISGQQASGSLQSPFRRIEPQAFHKE